MLEVLPQNGKNYNLIENLKFDLTTNQNFVVTVKSNSIILDKSLLIKEIIDGLGKVKNTIYFSIYQFSFINRYS